MRRMTLKTVARRWPAMGRTVPTTRMLIDIIGSGWADYRRALRDADREAFDRMMAKAAMHASAANFAVDAMPLETFFMSVLIEQEKELEELKRRPQGQ